jgi:hypothetical protein
VKRRPSGQSRLEPDSDFTLLVILRQIAVPVQTAEGNLVTFTRDRVTGWLFQPTVGDESILIIPTKKKLDRVPDTYPRVLLATVDNAAAEDRLELIMRRYERASTLPPIE